MWDRLKRALRFAGRAKRGEYWMTVLFAWLGVICLTVPAVIMPTLARASTGMIIAVGAVVGLVALVAIPYGLAAVLAISVRRLHDRNKTAWWLIPFVLLPSILNVIAQDGPQDFALIFALGAFGFGIWALFEIGILAGTPGENRFGPNPQA